MDIQSVLQKGEGISAEFKRAESKVPDNLFETVCAFLNRNGGIILLGVTDSGKVEGIKAGMVEKFCKEISNLSNNPQKLNPTFLLEPAVIDFRRKKLISVYVPVSSQVHRCAGKIFDRSVDGDYEVRSDDQIRNMYSRKSAYYSEGMVYPYVREADFVPGIVARVRQMMEVQRPDQPWNTLSDEEFYRISGLYRRDMLTGREGFTLAALLLFGQEEAIRDVVPHYKIDALLRRKDKERYDDRVNIRCNLIDAYPLLMQFIAKHLPDPFWLERDQRISLRDIIFREVIVNFLIHREYLNAYPASLIIYDNGVVLKNANKPHVFGELYPGNYEAFPKNPNIANIFTQIGRAEELGTGVRKVFQYIKMYSGCERALFREEDLFTVKILSLIHI